MLIRSGRSATRNLTRIGLVLSPRRGGVARRSALVVGVLWIGLGSAYLYFNQAGLYFGPASALVGPPAGAIQATRLLQQRLEQTQMSSQVAEARSHELERQIDALNQKLRESQEELTFFRKTRERKN